MATVAQTRPVLPSQGNLGGPALGGDKTQAEIEARFRQLVAVWKEQTEHLSSATKMAMHPAYQQIIGMGPVAVPWLLGELRREPDHWFWALWAITGADPIPPENRGKVVEMAQAWLKWGEANGYLAR